jgi:anti-anti-sigma factor
MQLDYSEADNGIRLIKLGGKLDIIGAGEIKVKFADYCAGDNIRVLVDLSEVNFLASIGIRLLMLTAKSMSIRGGRMVLLNPTADVKNVLELTGIPAVIPMYESLESAQAVLLAR